MKKIGLFLAAAILATILAAAFLRKSPPGSNSQTQATSQTVVSNAPQAETSTAARPIATSKPVPSIVSTLNSDPIQRKSQIDKLVEGMSVPERIKTLDQLWTEEASGAHRELVSELVRRWAQDMPQAAAEWLGQRPPGALQRQASQDVAIAWANQNLSDAAAWVRRWPEDEKEAGLLSVAYEAIRTAPKEALSLASELSPTQSRNALISQAVREWTSNDPSLPVVWADKMESSDLREQVFAAVAISLSETDPAAAANLALQKLTAGGRQDDTVVSIVQRWAQNAPQAAGDWVVQFPEGEVRNAAIENLVQLWAGKDANEAADWLNQIEDGSLRDSGLVAYSRTLAPQQPEAAIVWAEAISDVTMRDRQLASIASLWLASDNQAANAWLQNRPEISAALSRAPLQN